MRYNLQCIIRNLIFYNYIDITELISVESIGHLREEDRGDSETDHITV